MANLIYRLQQINNATNENVNGKYYARAVATETLSFDDFIEHIVSHGSVYDRGTVSGIMYQMLDCLRELVMDSKKVKFGDFGTFYVSLKSKSAESEEAFTLDNIEGVFLRFATARTARAALDSKSLRKAAKFKSIDELSGQSSSSDDSSTDDDTTDTDSTGE